MATLTSFGSSQRWTARLWPTPPPVQKSQGGGSGIHATRIRDINPLTDAGKQLNELLERHLRLVPVHIPFKNILDAEGHLPDEKVWKIPDVSELSFQWTLSCMSELRFKSPSIGLTRK